ncbi:HAD family hydrolase [uncultured Muribaculum sp.]|uniref:HAD family hydrolase n=1 Tax=uncultured Muribaculum sp. TaxID=1918613 RepID=UPI0025D9869B|nr:HAD family hydrolase [uncultured Muribaculum sp.]
MENTDIKGVIFDYGGTIDSRGVHWSEVIWDGYRASGVDVDKDTFREAYVYAERELAKVRHIMPEDNFHVLLLKKMRIELGWLAEHGHIDPSDTERLAGEIALYCYERARECVEEARPVLDSLKEHGVPMVLVSNFYGNVQAVLADFDLLRYFDSIVESAVVGVRKPDPQIFRLGVEALGLAPEQVLVVGDSYKKDIIPAQSLGCRVAWLKGKGWTAEEDAVTHPCIIENLTQAAEAVF